MKRYPEYKESDAEFIKAVPSHWQMKRLKHVTESINNGTTTPQIQSGQTDYPVTRIETISTGEINFDKVGHVNYWEGIENYRLRLGDILLSHINSLAILGNCAMFENSACLYHGMNLLRIRPNNLVDDRFLLYWLKSHPTNQLIKSFAKFAIGQVSISITNLKEIPITYPPLSEQTQIADFLNHKTGQIDELIRIKERRIELLHEQRTALINQAVTKGLDPNVEMKPSGVEWIEEIPAHWEILKVKHVGSSNPSKNNPKTTCLKEKPVVFLPMERVHTDGTIDQELRLPYSQLKNGYTYFEENDVLIAKVTPCFENGKIVLIKNLATPVGFGSTEFIVIRPNTQKVFSLFLYYILYNVPLRSIGKHFMTSAVGLKRVPTEFVENFRIPVPPKREQAQIANFLERKTEQTNDLISTEQRKIELLKEYRQSLISEAVTGKIDVRNEV